MLSERIQQEAEKIVISVEQATSMSTFKSIFSDVAVLRDRGLTWSQIALALDRAGVRTSGGGQFSEKMLKQYFSVLKRRGARGATPASQAAKSQTPEQTPALTPADAPGSLRKYRRGI